MTNQTPQHTPEPWSGHPTTHGFYYWEIKGSDAKSIGGINQDADMLRAINCVNACAGIANPEVIPELIETVMKYTEAKATFMKDYSNSDDIKLAYDRAGFKLYKASEALAKLDAPSLEGNQ